MSGTELAAFITLAVTASVTLTTVVRAYLRYKARDGAGGVRLPEVDQRLAHLEHAVDSIAIEIERISEGQRFTTKLLAERAGDHRAAPPSAGEARGSEPRADNGRTPGPITAPAGRDRA